MTARRQRSTRPIYQRKLLEPSTDAASERPIDELFFHLGYWRSEDPTGRRLTDLRAAQKRLNDRLLEMADLRDGLRVLDVGCGIGGTLADIGRSHTGMGLVGLNLDAEQLRSARVGVPVRAENDHLWVEADGCRLPLAAGSFDRVFAVECIFHFASRRDFFAESARVLKPGGRLVVSDFVVTDRLKAMRESDPAAALAIERTVVSAVGPWPDFSGKDDDVAIAAEAGLSLVECEDASVATQPSYRCFVEGDPIAQPVDAQAAFTDDPVERAMAVMEWLQANGHIEMQFLAFDRHPPD